MESPRPLGGVFSLRIGNNAKKIIIDKMNKRSTKSDKIFKPSFFFRNPHAQSIMASSQLRVRRKNAMMEKSREMIINTSAGSRLLSFLSIHPASKGLIILLHGWEGSLAIDNGYFFYRKYFLKKWNLNIPVKVFISEDDPVIPYEDYCDIKENKFFQISRQRFGGHCGFIDLFPLRCWYNQKIAEIIN